MSEYEDKMQNMQDFEKEPEDTFENVCPVNVMTPAAQFS